MRFRLVYLQWRAAHTAHVSSLFLVCVLAAIAPRARLQEPHTPQTCRRRQNAHPPKQTSVLCSTIENVSLTAPYASEACIYAIAAAQLREIGRDRRGESGWWVSLSLACAQWARVWSVSTHTQAGKGNNNLPNMTANWMDKPLFVVTFVSKVPFISRCAEYKWRTSLTRPRKIREIFAIASARPRFSPTRRVAIARIVCGKSRNISVSHHNIFDSESHSVTNIYGRAHSTRCASRYFHVLKPIYF